MALNRTESRYFNTARKMNEALIELLEIKDFEYITVSELCARAGVNRSTFYLHYENTRELLYETSRYLTDNFLSYFDLDPTLAVNRLTQCDLSELNFISAEYLHPYLSYIKENQRVFATALAHPDSLGFEYIYNQMFEYIFNPILERFHYPADDRKYVMAFYLNGINAIVSQWLKDGCDKSFDFISNVIIECIFGRLSDFDSNMLNFTR